MKSLRFTGSMTKNILKVNLIWMAGLDNIILKGLIIFEVKNLSIVELNFT